MNQHSLETPKQVGLARRLAAMIYDTLLLAAVVFIAAAPTAALDIEPGSLGSYLLLLYVLLVAFLFLGWFWTHGGQTLGMKTWRLRLERMDGTSIDWYDAGLRFATAMLSWAALGLGFVWSVFHPERLAWHDIASRTRLVRVPKGT
ncbi:MAG: RDD family protein [Chromatiales bacterium]|jgi:uncharacterized RDD family membrane protein YckC